MSDNDPKISVIIPTKNRAEMVRRFLPTLAEQTTSEHYEIIVVDNGSTDSTIEVVTELSSRWPFIRLITESKPGSAAACHAGALAAKAPLIMFVDDDMLAVPELVEEHLHKHVESPESCVLGQILSAESEHPFERMLAYIFDGPRLSLPNRDPEPSDYWSGNVSMPRSVYLGLGGYNQVFSQLGYGKDVDFGKRLVEAGIPIVFAEKALTLQHFAERFAERMRKAYRCGITYGYVRDNYPDLPIPGNVTGSLGLKDRVLEPVCRMVAFFIEPFDRGKGLPVKPLAFAYDLGIRIATRRGLSDYQKGRAKVSINN